MSSVVVVEGLIKSVNGSSVLDGVSFSVGEGEMLFVLGPSGAGKSFLLRVLAGLLKVDSGRVLIHGQDAGMLSAHQRGVAYVAQNNTLWPHLNVRECVAFALEQQRLGGEAVRGAVHSILGELALDALGGRLPADLSGGERQRVALARALVASPAVLLFDEPFAQLEPQERRRHWALVRDFCERVGAAAVCVTQHVPEALAVARQVLVLAAGRVLQRGSPLEVYRRPKVRFVGEFLACANVFPGTVLHAGAGEFLAETPLGEVRGGLAAGGSVPAGTGLDLLVRPEAWHLDLMAPEENAFPGKIVGGDFCGAFRNVLFRTEHGVVLRVAEANPRVGGSAGGGNLIAWVEPEEVIGIPTPG
ncbi:MAG: ABC transporter ATP-binding protein [Puniceicoccales bacterium]|nr:ABC transporter ATP-binding protein [Puniceicoccales bacterium]